MIANIPVIGFGYFKLDKVVKLVLIIFKCFNPIVCVKCDSPFEQIITCSCKNECLYYFVVQMQPAETGLVFK